MSKLLWTHERLKPKNWKGEPAKWKQVKFNGHRFTMFKQDDGTLVGFGRETWSWLEMSAKHPRIVEYPWWQKALQMPPRSSVDGELYVPGGNAGSAAHAIAECSPELQFAAFAVPYWCGLDIADKSLAYAHKQCDELGLPFAEYVLHPASQSENVLKQEATVHGIEGYVLKNYNYAQWWKVKPTKTIDLVVTGFVNGKGKYAGLVGSLCGSAWLDLPPGRKKPDWNDKRFHELAKVSGMDDATRADINREECLGRVFECEYQGVGNGGRLVHPRFVQWRDDKPARECKYDREDL